MKIQTILKALAAGYVAAIGSLSAAYVQGGGHISLISGLVAAGVGLSALAATWAVPNAQA